MSKFAKNILSSRKKLVQDTPHQIIDTQDKVDEGGCGVVGFAATVPVGGRHIFEPSIQMRNRGNGKGGGIAAAGLVPEQLGIDARTLRDDYIVQIALLVKVHPGSAARDGLLHTRWGWEPLDVGSPV